MAARRVPYVNRGKPERSDPGTTNALFINDVAKGTVAATRAHFDRGGGNDARVTEYDDPTGVGQPAQGQGQGARAVDRQE